uniref:Uncharacterized protein n=1 Tax=Glossina palpalis gambiensis TaxID=67801 RepID=A0A1B0AKQ9_9MUSC
RKHTVEILQRFIIQRFHLDNQLDSFECKVKYFAMIMPCLCRVRIDNKDLRRLQLVRKTSHSRSKHHRNHISNI